MPTSLQDEREVRSLNDGSWIIDSVLFFVMGMSGWWVINSIQWAESPVFVYFTPEKQKIGNWLSVACAIGNVFPLMYKGFLSKEAQSKFLSASIMACNFVAVATAVVCAIWWDTVATVFGQSHSAVLIICAIVSGGVGTLSNVTYWALAVRYPGTHCIKAMSVGMTVGGLIVASIALIQHAGHAPIFGVDVFMSGVAAVQALFTFCFIFILRRNKEQSNQNDNPQEPQQRQLSSGPAEDTDRVSVVDSEMGRSLILSGVANSGSASASLISVRGVPSFDSRNATRSVEEATGLQPILDENPAWNIVELTRGVQSAILFTMFMTYALTYALPSLGPIMVIGYKNGSPSTASLLRLMNLFQQLGDVLGRVATGLPWKPGTKACGVMAFSVFGISGLFIIAAAMSEQIPDIFEGGLAWLFPILFFVYYFVRGYLVTVLYVHVKLNMKPKDAEMLAGKMGLLGQIGSLLSNLALFFLINFLDVF